MERSFNDAQLLAGVLLVALLAVAGGQARGLRIAQALGLEQLLASSFLFLPLGMLLSEAGLGLINRAVTRELEALVTLGLGVLGLLLGLKLGVRKVEGEERTIVQSAAVESLSTLVLVGVPSYFLLELVPGARPGMRAVAAALLGCVSAISGARSLRTASQHSDPGAPGAISRVADYGTVAAVMAAGVLVALLTPTASLGRLERLLALAATGVIGGLSAWLLASETRDQALRTALLMGVLLVTAGTAAHLGLPPVAATLLTGITIAQLPGTLASELRTSLKFLEAPFTVLLLVLAGAALRVPTGTALIVTAVFLLLRTAGKILGGRGASWLSANQLPHQMGLGLLPSGAVALGLALDFSTAVRGPLGEVVMTTAVLGSLLSETAGVWTTRLLARALAVTGAAPEPEPPSPTPPQGTGSEPAPGEPAP